VSRVLLDRENMVVLEASGVVRGTVLVRETRRPPEEICYVSASGISGIGAGGVDLAEMLEGGGGRSTSTDNGVFELYLPAGTYRLEAKAAGFTPGRAEVSVASGSVTDGVEIFISKGGGRIAGRVVVTDGKSPQGATVVLVETGSSMEAAVIAGFADGMGDREVRVGSDGAFSFENLPAGTYSAIARHPSYASADSGPLELAEQGNIANVELRMGVGGALEGYVYVANRATAGVVVMVLGQGTTKTVATDQNGHYYIDGLATGTYQAMITAVGSGDLSGIFETRGVPVEIMDGRTTRYDFGRGTGTRIEGRCMPGPQLAGTAVLRTPGPQVVALGQTVQMNQLVGGWNTLINPLDGGFVLEDIPPGEWQLDIFFMEFAIGVRYMHSEIITVQGEEVLPLDITIKF